MSSSGCSEQSLHPLFLFLLNILKDITQRKGVDEKYDCGAAQQFKTKFRR